jgi:splicing factor 3A subunit 1
MNVIYPPPELKTVVDTTAQFVSRNGKDFEHRILSNETSKSKFGFLLTENPYHAYYLMRIDDFTKNPSLEIEKPKKLEMETVSKKSTNLIQTETPTSDPFVYSYHLNPPDGISALELDIIQQTAQYVARNGKQFLSALAGRESRNSMFDFLKIHHKYFTFFTHLCEIYKKVLIPTPNVIQDLLKWSDSKQSLLQTMYSKAEWENKKVEVKEDVMQEDRVKQTGDWTEFVLVETIQWTTDDYNKVNEMLNTIQEESEMGDDDMELEDIKIVKNYKKKEVPVMGPNMVLDPLSGEMIPMDSVKEHLRVGLMSHQWKIQKDKEMEKFKTTNLSTGEEMTRNLLKK